MKLSDMPAVKAKRIMTELIPYVSHLHNDAIAIEIKQSLENDGYSFLQFIEAAGPIVMSDELQDKIVSLMVDKSLAEVQAMPMSEYMAALNEFSLRDLVDFFGWWLVTIRQV